MADKVEDTNEIQEGTAAADTIKTKSGAISDFVKKMQGMSHDDITNLAAQFATVDKNVSAATDFSAKNKASIAMKPSDASAVREDIALIFGDDNKDLTEDFLDKTTTLFEAALSVQVAVLREEIFEEAAEVVQEQVNEEIEKITENLEDYLSYAVKEWLEENKIAIESGIKTVQAESFIDGLKTLFNEHNIDIPEDKVDVVESLTDEIDELKEKLNEQITKNIDNQKIIDEAHKEQLFDEIAEGLAATQVEKLRTLSEGVDYSDLTEYRKKVETIKEHHFKVATKSSDINNEDPITENKAHVVPSGPMSAYSSAITKNVKYT